MHLSFQTLTAPPTTPAAMGAPSGVGVGGSLLLAGEGLQAGQRRGGVCAQRPLEATCLHHKL